MKVTKQETLYHEDHGATLKHKCGKKDSSIVPFYFLFFLGLPFFWPFSFFGTMLYKWLSSHFYLFTTQWLQLDTRTKYDSIWMPPAVYRDMQWIKSDMYESIMNGGFATNTMSTTWSCKAIWQWWTCHDKLNGGKLHGNISRNGYGNAIIRRYGGCVEEDIRRLLCDRAYHITGFGCTGEVCTNSQGEKGQMHGTEEASNDGRVRVRIIHGLNIIHK